MKHFALDLRVLSPLAMRADHAPEGVDTASYISGNTLAGSLAAVYRQFYPDNTHDFENLFLSGQVHYPDLYPATFRNERMQEEVRYSVYPLPKTAQTCKRFQGVYYVFDGEKVEVGSRHGVRDSLLDWAMFRLAEKKISDPAALLKPFEEYEEKHNYPDIKTGTVCPHAMDNASGYYRRDEQSGHIILAKMDTHLQTRTGIHRGTGTVQEGILYNRRVFEEDSRFWGVVKVEEELTPIFSSFITEVGMEGWVRIGTGRTRGMGKVQLKLEKLDDEQQRLDAFGKRLRKFDKLLRETVKVIFKDTSPPDHVKADKPFYFALTLHSPAILRDDFLRYRGVIDEDTLAKLLGVPAERITPIHHVASTKRITGWNDLWGTPRINEIAIETGSVFLFSSSLPQSELERALFRLEEEGIGQRRAEGFGRVCVADSFHREVTLI